MNKAKDQTKNIFNLPHPQPLPTGRQALPRGKGELRVALIHDFLVNYGGAERVLEVLAEMFPEAPIYTLLYDREKMSAKGGPASGWENKEIRTSYLQKFPKFLKKRYQWLLPFYMSAPETFDLRDFDLVISSSGAWSKGVITRLNTIHIAYLHSPMRFVWEHVERITHNAVGKFFVRIILNYVRIWDALAAKRPDYLISNSKYTQRRVQKFYRRDSEVIYPPALNELNNRPLPDPLPKGEGDKDRYFLIVSRLSPYKKADVAIEAFNKLGLPLIVIGEGKQKKYLEKIAKDNVKILGFLKDSEVAEYYQNARAFVFPADDDFGMTIVEAMSWGVPVIAFRKGGALEIVEEGKTGEFFRAQTPEVLADGIRRFIENEGKYRKEDIIKRAKEFSKERFKKELHDFIDRVLYKSKG